MGKVKKDVLNKRRQLLLKIVVQEHILTGMPIASGYIVSKYELNVSPATIRNDLAYLESRGFLKQPHLSAGRIPTDKGYKFYTEEILDRNFISDEEKVAVEQIFEKKSFEIEELHLEVARTIAKLTKCFGIAAASSSFDTNVVLFELVRLSESRLLLLLVSDNGNVYRKEIDTFEDVPDDVVEYVRSRIKSEILGMPMLSIKKLNALTGPEEHKNLASAYLYNRIVSELKRIVEEVSACTKVYISAEDVDWVEDEYLNPEALSKIYSISGQKNPLSELVEEAITMNKVVVKIGQENPIASDFSIVIAPYASRKFSGAVGVIGPKRMNYLRAVSAARYVSRQLAEIFSRS
ncbi:MAG: heat-inducible transcriptional repressor HrcA [Actinobacteria bacterium]|nr:heat-inducible transcriptional repressor HrcA [Actinomycetota bacterium]